MTNSTSFEALELYAGMVQRFEHNGDTPEAGTKGEVTHER